MVNNIAIDMDNNTVHSINIYNLRSPTRRTGAREIEYKCPHCLTEVRYAHSGKEGCFKHLPTTPQSVKESCPYYSGLLSGSSVDVALAIEAKKQDVKLFLEENDITGYNVITYYSEPNLVRYIENHPTEDFIIVGNMITRWEYETLDNGYLQLRKKAIAKYLSSSHKSIIQTFVGTDADKIFLTKYISDYYNDVKLHPYFLNIANLREKDFSDLRQLMTKRDINHFRITIGKHDNRVMPQY